MRAWISRALCAHFSSLPWIAEPDQRGPAAERSMRLVCDICPALDECRTYVHTHMVTSGFWAGEDRTPVESDSAGGAA